MLLLVTQVLCSPVLVLALKYLRFYNLSSTDNVILDFTDDAILVLIVL